MGSMMKGPVAWCVCVYLIAQLMVCEAKPSKAKTGNHKLPTLRKHELEEVELELELLQMALEKQPEYDIIESFIEKPACGIVRLDGLDSYAGGMIVQVLGVASLMVAEGCSEGALKAMWLMVNALAPNEVLPVTVSNTSACSTEADEGIRMLLSEIPILRKVYTLMAAGLYLSANCEDLAADLLPTVVRLSFSISNKEPKLANYEEMNSPKEVIHACADELQRLKQDLHAEKQVKDNRRRKRQDGCEKSWESSIYSSIKEIPVIGALWEIGSAIGYAIAGCSDVASQRGKDGAASVAKVLTAYFVTS